MGITMTDPISDLLARIRNSLSIGRYRLVVPHSKMRANVLKVLKEAGYISGVSTKKAPKPQLEVTLSEGTQGSPRIKGLKRVSKPGRRVYVSAKEIPTIRGGRGVVIISTSQGVMSGHRAKARKLGGEVICEVW